MTARPCKLACSTVVHVVSVDKTVVEAENVAYKGLVDRQNNQNCEPPISHHH